MLKTVNMRFYWIVFVLATIFGLSGTVAAATFTVSNSNDSGAGSFRQAIADANAAASDDLIEFDANVFNRPQSVVLTSGVVNIENNGSLQINGTGADLLTISGNNQTSVLFINNNAVVAISSLTVANGGAVNNDGGGIFNRGILTINECLVKNNFATFSGGGIYNTGTLTVNKSRISENSGAGIVHLLGTATVNNSTISNNFGTGVASSGIFQINNSTVSFNTNSGLSNSNSTMTVTNSTVSNNFRNSTGGGITLESGILNLVNSTVAFNSSAPANGGGVYRGFSATVNARNSIIAQNTGNGAPSDFAGVLNSQGYNLIGTTVFATISGNMTGNIINVDARLKPLAANGGETQTCALQPDSPAIDAGDAANVLPTDQRGVTRPFDGDGNGSAIPDIGAVEAGILVTNTNDGGTGSLRQAIAEANVSAANDEIRFSNLFDTTQTIVLTSGDLSVAPNGSLFINGPGAEKLTVSGNDQSRVVTVDANATAALAKFKISAGRTTQGSGGGILNSSGGTLSLTEMEISGNTARDGGGIFNEGVLTVSNAFISSNDALEGGGGISNLSGTIKVNNSVLDNNSAVRGGAVHNAGVLSAANSTFRNNDAGNNGGAIFHLSGTMNVYNSVVNHNLAAVNGGGIYTQGNLLTLTNTTVSNNTAVNNTGGGIIAEIGTTELTHVTVAFNSAQNGGGAASGALGMLNARNTIFAVNSGAASAPDFSGTLNSLGYNLIGNTAGTTITGNTTGNLLNVNPQLAALTFNGGPTQTIALLGNSPAIDAGDPVKLSSVDQRGVNRAADGNGDGTPRADIGAYESGTLVANTNNSGAGSLRQAILDARAAAGDDEIRLSALFDTPQTIVLGGTELFIGGNGLVTIYGGGNLTISGGSQSRVFNVGAFGNLKLFGVTVSNGRVLNGDGGGILIQGGALTLDNCVVRDNTANGGGGTPRGGAGIYNNSGKLTVKDSAISGNILTGGTGGGILTNNGTVSIANSSIQNNTASNEGGGIHIYAGTVTIDSTAISSNTAPRSGGILNGGTLTLAASSVKNNTAAQLYGGIYNGFQMTIVNSTISGNQTGSTGGGIFNLGSLSLVNSTVSGNTAQTGGGINNNGGTENDRGKLTVLNSTISGNRATSSGGGIYTVGGIVKLTNTTLAFNSAATAGGGVANFNTAFSARNTIFAGNTFGSSAAPSDFSGTLASQGFNLIGNTTGATISGDNTGNRLNVNAMLDPVLRDNGGATKTHALRIGSPATDAGAAASLAEDQRGLVRPFDFPAIPNAAGGNGSDIGAFERQSSDIIRTATRFDFDGDAKADISVFRPSDGSWWYLRSLDNQFRVFSFGVSTDVLAPGDYTGDGRTDICVFRPSTGEWFVQRSEDNSYFSFPFGTAGDLPAPSDFDGDGKTDAAVFRPASGTWFILNSDGSGTSIVNFGTAEDKPVPADFDGDGKSDIAIFRPSDGSWWYLQSSNSQFKVYRFGVGTDKPSQGDYTGDGKSDLAVFRPSTGEWFIQRSEDNSYFSFPFGTSGDLPVAGDYDGDGRFDAAVFRPSNLTWYLNQSVSGVGIVGFGAAGDQPVPNVFVP